MDTKSDLFFVEPSWPQRNRDICGQAGVKRVQRILLVGGFHISGFMRQSRPSEMFGTVVSQISQVAEILLRSRDCLCR